MLILICGHSRAGKTTYSKRYNEICKVIHLDDTGSLYEVIKEVKKQTDDVVVEGIYYNPKDRLDLIKSYSGKGLKCICLDTPQTVREERIGHKLKFAYPFLIPTLDEGWDEIIIIRGDDNVECVNREKQT